MKMPNTTMYGYHAYAIYIMSYNILRKKRQTFWGSLRNRGIRGLRKTLAFGNGALAGFSLAGDDDDSCESGNSKRTHAINQRIRSRFAPFQSQ